MEDWAGELPSLLYSQPVIPFLTKFIYIFLGIDPLPDFFSQAMQFHERSIVDGKMIALLDYGNGDNCVVS